jgi:hypothetical protein
MSPKMLLDMTMQLLKGTYNRSDWISKTYFERVSLNLQCPKDLKLRDYKQIIIISVCLYTVIFVFTYIGV